jgi:hypothetical protein
MTHNKYVEMHPGSFTMYEYAPVRVEYEVANIEDGMISVVTQTGEEKIFKIPENDLGTKLNAEFTHDLQNNGGLFWTIVVIYAPTKLDDGWKAVFCIESYKLGK